MVLSHCILAFLWTLYCVLHSLLAGVSLKNKLRRRLGSRFIYYRIWYTVFAFLFLALIIYFQVKMQTLLLFRPGSLILGTGVLLSTCGLGLMIVCIRKYFMSMSGLLSLFRENLSNELMITGIHRYVRHPLYLGTFVFVWGLFLVMPYLSLLIADTIITVYTLIGIKLEEDKLALEFGETYQKYRRTVPMLLPFGRKRRVRQ